MKRVSYLFLTAAISFSTFAKAEVVPYISQNIPAAAIENILEAERVFCYTVEMPSPGYTGYTIDQLALTGFCGQLGDEKQIFVEEFFEKEANVVREAASCQIEPKIMLRFVRGVDFADVLFSDTCPSITVFYGGTMRSFNMAPAKKSFEAVTTVFNAGKIDFVSPALLNQLMPCGVALSAGDKEIISGKKSAPVRNWKDETSQEQQEPQSEAPKGWNKLQKK